MKRRVRFWEETREVLARPDFGLTPAEVDERFQDLWLCSWILPPVPATDPRLLAAVKGDVKDLPVLATGLATLTEQTLGTLPRKFLVSNNETDFTPGQIVYELEFIKADAFWRHLQQGAKAKAPRPRI